MPFIEANGVSINYSLEESTQTDAADLLVLVNGLADDLSTWAAQVPAFLDAGYTVLRYDNRGIGKSSRPQGPYTAGLLAEDLHELLNALEKNGALAMKHFHLLGVSMGGMIAQAYALRYSNSSVAARGWKMSSLMLCCTYAQPTTFCSRMFGLWADMARNMSVQDVMRDVTLWAFTVPFFRRREDELEEVEKAMKDLDMGTEEYLAQLNVIQRFDSTARLDALKADEKVLGNLEQGKVLVLAGQTDILIPVVLSRELMERIESARWTTVKGGHGCLVSLPSPQSLLCSQETPGSTSVELIYHSGSSPAPSTRPSSISWTNAKIGSCDRRADKSIYLTFVVSSYAQCSLDACMSEMTLLCLQIHRCCRPTQCNLSGPCVRITALINRIRRPSSLAQHTTHIDLILPLLLLLLPQRRLLSLFAIQIRLQSGLRTSRAPGVLHSICHIAFTRRPHLLCLDVRQIALLLLREFRRVFTLASTSYAAGH